MSSQRYSQIVELRGHIIDSLMLPRIMDELMGLGVEYEIQRLDVGQHKDDPSYARLEIVAPTPELLQTALLEVQAHGATPLNVGEAEFEPAPADGVFPERFYSTTNLETHVRRGGQWVPVRYPEMDCGVALRGGLPECVLASRCCSPVAASGSGRSSDPARRRRSSASWARPCRARSRRRA
jgi:hypothetical protein